MKDWYSPPEYADKIGVSRQTVLEWCRAGLLPGVYRVNTRWRIPHGTPPPSRSPGEKYDPKGRTLALVS